MPRGGARRGAGRPKAIADGVSRPVNITAHGEAWRRLEFMKKVKGTSLAGVISEIIHNYVDSLELCPICEADEKRRRGCTGCGGMGYNEQLSLKV